MSSPAPPLVLERGQGALVYDVDGREYIDSTGGLWFCNVGHGRAELADVAAEQMRRLAAYTTFGRYSHPHAEPLAARLAELAPVHDPAVFFTCGGSEAVETAMKMVRRYWKAVGQPQRELVVARDAAYHGMSSYGTSLGGIPANARGYGTLVDGVLRVPRDDVDALEGVLREHGQSIAAFIGEPVIGAGGVYPPAAGYWSRVQELCRAHDVLLVADEVVSGFGRLGEWFGSGRFGIEPDAVVIAKGVTSGYQPLGALIAGKRLRAPFWDGRAGVFRHGFTYSGHPVACAVAMANLDILEEEQLVGRARDLEPAFADLVGTLADHPLVHQTRTLGLMAAVDPDPDCVASNPDLPSRLAGAVAANGVLTRALADGALQLSPPLVITLEQVEAMTDAIRRSLDYVAAGIASAGAISGRLPVGGGAIV